MTDIIKDHYIELLSLLSMIVAVVITALYKIGWIRIGKSYQSKEWNGTTERRECTQHPVITQKVCSLYTKLEEVDKKLDGVAEKLQYVLGSLEHRWREVDKRR